jgi:hypothetical protein
MRKHLALTTVTCLLLALAAGSGSVQSSLLKHERLRVRNTFKSPEEVVSYYCARDASGFVWSGLLDSERTAFTKWPEAPQVDSFYIAKSYKVHPGERIAHDNERASVEVSYELLATGDAHGTRTPPPRADYKVTFDLNRVNGAWKIVKPGYAEIAPIVLEAKFPYAKPAAATTTTTASK